MIPRFGAPAASRSCSGDFTEMSRALRASAAATPTASPARRPRARVIGRPMDDGAIGTAAGCTTRTATACGAPARTGRSSSSTRRVKTVPTRVGDLGCALRRPVDHCDVDQHGVEGTGGGDLLRQFLRSHRQTQPPNDVLAHPPATDQLHVGRDPLLRELRSLVGGARRVAALRRDVHRQRGGVLGRPQREPQRAAGDTQDDRDQHDDPLLAEHPQVVVDRHCPPP